MEPKGTKEKFNCSKKLKDVFQVKIDLTLSLELRKMNVLLRCMDLNHYFGYKDVEKDQKS